ncbi:SDR family NAD(P)-dependent oxidoreductase [Hydrogenophaga sp.]
MLKNKVALVTGAGSGIGRAVALVCAREGASLVVSDIDADSAQATADLVRAVGNEVLVVQADVGTAADSEHLVERCCAHYGRLDVACNNAGISGPSARTADYPLDGWDQVVRVNLSGVFYGMKYQIAAMLRTGGGSIVNVASILGMVGFATAPAYAATKHGVVGPHARGGTGVRGRGHPHQCGGARLHSHTHDPGA